MKTPVANEERIKLIPCATYTCYKLFSAVETLHTWERYHASASTFFESYYAKSATSNSYEIPNLGCRISNDWKPIWHTSYLCVWLTLRRCATLLETRWHQQFPFQVEGKLSRVVMKNGYYHTHPVWETAVIMTTGKGTQHCHGGRRGESQVLVSKYFW